MPEHREPMSKADFAAWWAQEMEREREWREAERERHLIMDSLYGFDDYALGYPINRYL